MTLTATCPSCGHTSVDLADSLAGKQAKCSQCGISMSVPAPMKRIKSPTAAPVRQQVPVSRESISAASRVLVSTTQTLDGYNVARYLGVESVERVIGSGLLSEVTTGIQDMVGARSTAFETKLQAAKDDAFGALKVRAVEKGANAVIGVSLAYAPFDGNRMAVIVSGTLVKLKPSA